MPSSSRSRGSGRGPDAAQNPKVPKSERQQLAIVMQISSQDVPPAAPITIEERKRTRQQRNERGETPLHTACIKGDVELVQKLLDQGLDPDQPDFAGWTPLHEACSYGNYPVVELLVNHGVNLNVKGLDDDTPLHDAVTTGNLRMVKLLVDRGAEPFVKNAHGFTPGEFTVEPYILEYFAALKDSNAKANHIGRARDDSKKGNASSSSEACKRSSMEGLAPADTSIGKDDKRGDRDDNQVSSGVVSSTQDDCVGASKRAADDDDDDEATKRKKRKEAEDRELMGKPAPVPRSGVGRLVSGSKPPGPASKTGATPLGKGGGQAKGKGPAQGKGSAGKVNAQTTNQGKSGGKGVGSQSGKQDRKSPVASPKPSRDDGDEEPKSQEAPKVPPLKIVIPGGAGGSAGRNDQEGEGGSGGRGGGKGRGGSSTLPYVIPCTSGDMSQSTDTADSHDDKRAADSTKAGQRVLRSHRNDGEKERGKERKSPHLNHYKSPHAWGSGLDDHAPSTSGSLRSESASASGSPVELHPRKRKMKASRESHAREAAKASEAAETSVAVHNVTHSNPYQMYIHIRKQIERRQKGLFPVKPKPPKDFNKYLMNRCTYTLQGSMNPEPQVEIPPGLPPQMAAEFTAQEKERTRLRVQHLVEKEKLVLAVEQEILRVHGRAERAVANQALPFSVCTMLRDREVYNVLAPEQEEKRNAQRSRCNGRQINSWLQEVDDKWEKIKEGMLRRQHTEAETLHAVQMMGWEWKLKEVALCDYKTTPKIDSTHVPQIHVSNFDLPA